MVGVGPRVGLAWKHGCERGQIDEKWQQSEVIEVLRTEE